MNAFVYDNPKLVNENSILIQNVNAAGEIKRNIDIERNSQMTEGLENIENGFELGNLVIDTSTERAHDVTSEAINLRNILFVHQLHIWQRREPLLLSNL